MHKDIFKRALLVVISAGGLALNANIAAQESYPASVRATGGSGTDGGAAYFQITCSDRRQGSAIVFDDDRVCLQRPGNELECRKDWELADAAAEYCR